MHIPFAMLVSLALALPMLAAPVVPVVRDIEARDLAVAASSNETISAFIAHDEFTLETRKAKAKAVKAKPIKKAAPKKVAPKKVAPKKAVPKKVAPKKVAAKPAAKKVAAKPVAKKPAAKKVAAKPVAKKPAAKKVAAKPVAKKPAAKAPVKAKAPVAAKKPVAKKAPAKATTATKAKPVAKKPAAKPVAKKPAAKPVAKPAAKPAAKAPAKKVTTAAKKPAATKAKPVAKKPAAKPAAKAPAKVTTAAKKPAAKPVAKKPAAKAPAKVTPAKKPVAKKPTTTPKKAPVKTAPKAPAKSAVKPKASAAAACPLKPAAKTTKKTATKPKRMLNALNALARRVVIADRTLFGLIQPRLTGGNEFIGWHGTNEKTAALWEGSGEIVRPTTVEGQTTGRSGLDAELGAGLYISDTLSVAEAAAAINAKNNNLKGKVCAIFAKSSANFRGAQDKVQIPEIIRGNAAVKEQERQSYITTLPGKVGRKASLLLGPLGTGKNQMMIVEALNPNFEAQCFDVTGLDSADAQAFEKAGNKVSYTSSSIISEWKIRKEDATIAKAVVAAIEKKCP